MTPWYHLLVLFILIWGLRLWLIDGYKNIKTNSISHIFFLLFLVSHIVCLFMNYAMGSDWELDVSGAVVVALAVFPKTSKFNIYHSVLGGKKVFCQIIPWLI